MNYLSDAALGYEHHLALYRGLLTGNPANDDYFRGEAADLHMRVVIDGVSDLRIRAIQEGGEWSGELQAHLTYGVGRRTGDIWAALREILAVSPVTRAAPLSSDEAIKASTALNTTYINIRGVLDNFAWAMIEKAGGLSAVGLSHTNVDLFGTKFLAIEALGNLPQQLAPLKAWSGEVKDRRNPAAHRIPLAVVPALVTDDQAAEIQRLTADMLAPLRAGHLDAAGIEALAEHQANTRNKIDRIGIYRPLFAHMPSEGVTQLYPTVAEDVGRMVRAGRHVLEHLAASRSYE